MPRCDYDAVFYRVLFLTLIGIAVTFTVVLTNVFVDIGGLLRRENINNEIEEFAPGNIVTKHDDEISENNIIITNDKYLESTTDFNLYKDDNVYEDEFTYRTKRDSESVPNQHDTTNLGALDLGMNSTVLLNVLAVHNILLDEIVKHIDNHEVRKAKESIKEALNDAGARKHGSIEFAFSKLNGEIFKVDDWKDKSLIDSYSKENSHIENMQKNNQKIHLDNNNEVIDHVKLDKDPGVLINTFINITSNSNNTNIDDEIKGVVNMIYNGKPVKIVSSNNLKTVTRKSRTEKNNVKEVNNVHEIKHTKVHMSHLSKKYLNKLIDSYFQEKSDEADENTKNYDFKRIKRHIKIHYRQKNNTHKENDEVKYVKKNKDKFVVEIETSLDGKQYKGLKRETLIKDLVNRIQNAIHFKDHIKTDKRHLGAFNVKPRVQNPLDNDRVVVAKNDFRVNQITKRRMGPISKSFMTETAPVFTSRLDGLNKITGPKYLTVSKSINSAELGEINIDYEKILKDTGISQRLQKPINTENVELDDGNIINVGNMKFFIKNVDPTGISFGIDQIVDSPSEKQNVMVPDNVNPYNSMEEQNDNSGYREEVTKSRRDHVLVKRGINQYFYDTGNINEFVKNNRDSYLGQDLFSLSNNGAKKITNSKQISRKVKFLSHHRTKDNEVITKIKDKQFRLTPTELFHIRRFLTRKRRSILEENPVKIGAKRKSKSPEIRRTKRELDKITIISGEDIPNLDKHLKDGNIFVVTDDETVFEDSRNSEVRNGEDEEQEASSYSNPVPFESKKHNIIPSEYFSSRSRHNLLMSKYPHILMEEISRSKEEDFMKASAFISKLFQGKNSEDFINFDESTSPKYVSDDLPSSSHAPKASYKLSVKILPKNETGSGFKEIHTTINKSYNKNGILYSSVVNVSEISKVVNTNSTDDIFSKRPLVTTLKDKQEKMKTLFRAHKLKMEEYLNNLNKEKDDLDKLREEDIKINNTLKMLTEKEQIKQSDINRMVQEALLKIQSTTIKIETTLKTETPTSTIPQTTTTTTTTTLPTTIKTTTPDPYKEKLLLTIHKNEQLTYAILNKINKNTELLSTFLHSLTQNANKEPKVSTPTATRKNDWRNDPFFVDEHKYANHTPYSIPFVYAVQQVHSEKNEPLASVVYQGNIHTNIKGFNNNKPQFNKRIQHKTEVKPLNNEVQPKLELNEVVDNAPKNVTNFFMSDDANAVGDKIQPRNNNMRKNFFFHHFLNSTPGT